ncbi:hypothetical protein ND980_15535 [Vibrio diabolicus]|uniref:hypothetical protein n=1 Tax=Vibrio harveyi group TaxID=717610 RepID=UPI001BD383D3|nr:MULTISPECIES: hypothetical protein [Vibrio harveyi group]MBT0085575.1 hypothetical protein [Vibrio alginolyticus]MCS0393638.1 hypothetical protein [Vibrio diabolicus]HCH1032409.1 hypothetical protein [Vibrio parahaemolyticus]
MGISKSVLGMVQSTKKCGSYLVTLSNDEISSISKALGLKYKKTLTFVAVAQKQGIRTDEVRLFADCSNVPQAAIDANKKLMNFGLMLVCDKPTYGASNSGFHYWYLVKAPIMYLPVDMAVNDGRM